jgi:hypothetical protein
MDLLDASTLLESRSQARVVAVSQCIDGSYGVARE